MTAVCGEFTPLQFLAQVLDRALVVVHAICSSQPVVCCFSDVDGGRGSCWCSSAKGHKATAVLVEDVVKYSLSESIVNAVSLTVRERVAHGCVLCSLALSSLHCMLLRCACTRTFATSWRFRALPYYVSAAFVRSLQTQSTPA